MAIKTPEEYYASIKNDGRVVYCRGEKIEDVTTHPLTRRAAHTVVLDYIAAQKKEFHDLIFQKKEEGELVPASFVAPRSKEDLYRRRNFIQMMCRQNQGHAGGAKLTGADGLHGLTIATSRIDKAKGTRYSENLAEYRKYLQETDAALSLCMTDVKGDRSLHPGKQKQHKDFFVHIVDENKDGIVVRGAKAHISFSPVAHEMLVLPCRAMTEEDKDYAVSFGIPCNAKGLTHITAADEFPEEEDTFNYSPSSKNGTADAIVVFDDVFVPNERVFLKREWEYSAVQTYMFANFHRLTSDSMHYIGLETAVGIAALMAEYNGIEKYQHVRDKLTWLVAYAETVEALGKQAVEECVYEPDTPFVYPNPMLSNIGKLWAAQNHAQAEQYIQDIGGGLLATIPDHLDFLHPVTGPMLDKYLAGKDGIPTEHRMRLMNLIRAHGNIFNSAGSIHAEGSLAAQRLSIYALADFDRYKAAARKAAAIPEPESKNKYKAI